MATYYYLWIRETAHTLLDVAKSFLMRLDARVSFAAQRLNDAGLAEQERLAKTDGTWDRVGGRRD